MKYLYPLASSTWSSNEIDALNKVVSSGNFTMGKYVEEFELNFANYVKSKYCLMVNSGSSANLLMIAALFYTKNKDIKLHKGDEVIVPAVSWSTTYFPLYQYGLKIKFVDINIETLNYDTDKLREAISKNTKVILAVNLLGNPNDFSEINSIIAEKKITLLEDNCESLGATFENKSTGTFGLMGSFSSFFSHHISTMEGGLIVTDNEELYHILLSLRAHGWTRNLPRINKVCSEKSIDYFDESFRFILPGYNLRPLELSGVVGIEQLTKLPEFIRIRQENARKFISLMKDHTDLIVQKEIGNSSWFGFSIIIKSTSKMNRRTLVTKLNSKGFECRPIVAGNFTKNEVIKYFDYEIHGNLTNADHLHTKGLFIGNHHYPIDDAIQKLKEI